MKLKKRKPPVGMSDTGITAEKGGCAVGEYALAAFLTGKLEPPSRKEVATCLAWDADARELLHMASEALRAAAA